MEGHRAGLLDRYGLDRVPKRCSGACHGARRAVSDMDSSLLECGADRKRAKTPQRGCRPLVGLAAAAEEEQRETALGACHVVTVTPRRQAAAQASSRKLRGGRPVAATALWSDAVRTRPA